jgi:hypothetical protein
MKHICINCKIEFDGRKNKIYCSNKCRDCQKFIKIKNNEIKYNNRKNKQKICEKRWYNKNGKRTKLEYNKSRKFKDYQNKWRRDRKYWLEQYEKNSESHRDKAKRNRKTLKGKLNILKCNQTRRKKIWMLTGKSIEKLEPSFLINIRERDKVYVYCKKDFNESIHTDKETFDHLDCDKPLSLDNALRCCWSCNSSKRNVPIDKVTEWIKRKRFNPSPIVIELINKKKKNKSI